MGVLGNYVEALARRREGPSSGVARVGHTVIPPVLMPMVKAWATAASIPYSRRRAKQIEASGDDVALHLGCGHSRPPGWLNIDMFGTAADLPWDLRRPLPFAPRSIAAIFSEHLYEHLPYAAGNSLTEQCFRLLRPGGVIRIGVPDAGKYLESYCGDGAFLRIHRPQAPTRMLAVAEVFYRHGHVSAWDAGTLCLLLADAGFSNPHTCDWGVSELVPAPDQAHRRTESLYVEAFR